MVLFKNRYLVMEVFLDPNRELAGDETIILTQFNVSKAIKDSIHLNFGECGLAAAIGSFQVKYVNPITKVCIIRVARQDYQKIWCAITMVRNIGNCPVIFNLLNLSGCIRACKREALKCDEAKFELYKLTVGDNLSPQVLQQKCEQRPRFQPHPICFMGKCPALLRLSMEEPQ
ncbi:probable ribonuclease P/MRP protein subunit POP5 isoform X12 [Amborella trichopoda]|uniref:probable ribonuclease P/MRP protein subunit POP5 isoform X12 n=1 Tax=Amborella trichopoda TaxID=13333 RepID=UPI0009BE25F7|nr:probable ribonuclease P/MRP protein subunit POP5 isoform X12 [Amborella trichopoda]|eukprot:XP_020524185.1 probable ribonuclease P/MRP protein subunit POP5 isoform X12 [Amborella trichopoda]